jgi:transcriptional regulator with XRE-family HTH domain
MGEISSKIGERLNYLRNKNNITQLEMAKICNCTQRAISYWESGKRDIPIDKLIDLCKFFKVDPNFFLQPEESQKDEIEKIWDEIRKIKRRLDSDLIHQHDNHASVVVGKIENGKE